MRTWLLRGSALVPAALAMTGVSSAVFAQAVNMGGRGNSIVPDGRTATTLAVQGSVTSIRTSTFAGGNAYNSFSTFSEAAGNTVNLIVPKRAHNLVNLVRNGAVNIQGTLNAYQNGRIGGNVVFADSYGFVVGRSGVVNVGGLTVVTPSGETLDQIIDARGHVNEALAAQTIAGNVPLSSDGSVVIGGRINARDFVRITAQDVRVAGSYEAAKRAAMHRAQFESTVNAEGMVEGGSIVVRNGSISIVAANNARIGGNLQANGGMRRAGSISVTAGHNLSIGASASLTASALNTRSRYGSASAPTITLDADAAATISGTLSVTGSDTSLPGDMSIKAANISVSATARLLAVGTGTQNGGQISLMASENTSVATGAAFYANALGSGNGGFIDVSAAHTDNIAAGTIFDLGATTGTAGTLLFDPDQLIVGGVSKGSQGDNPVVGGTSTLASIYTDGGNVELDAESSIEIAGVIDTREYAGVSGGVYVTGSLAGRGVGSEGNSGAITLKAPDITIDTGAALYADVYNVDGTAFTPGAVTLSTVCPSCLLGEDQPETGTITINGTIAGASLTANANGGTVEIAGTVDVRPQGVVPASVDSAIGPILIYGSSITVEHGGTLYADSYNSTDAHSSVELNASSSVTVDGTIDTRAYTGAEIQEALSTASVASTTDSGSILLNAPSISVASTGAIYADVNNVGGTKYKGGAVTLDATASDYEAILEASATASITIDGTITGASIAANANATAEAVFALNSNNTTPGNLSTVLTMSTLLDLSPLSLSPGYVQADGTSSVTIDGTANLDATGNITLNSHTVGNASDPALGLSPGGAFFSAGAVVGILDQTTTTEIADGAHISAGSLNVAATNDATADIGSTVVTGFAGQTGAPFVVTVAYGAASINSTAEIDSGAVINVSGAGSSVDVLARNDNSFAAHAKSYARTGGVAAVAVAIGDFNSSAVAHIGANIGSSSAQVGSVSVVANSETSKDQVSATAIDGQGLFGDIFTTIGLVGNVGSQAANGSVTPPTAGIVSTIIGNKYGSDLSGALPQFAGAVSVSTGTQTSDADISADLGANGDRIVAAAPTIDASGNVAIVSDTTDAALANIGASTVNSMANGTSVSAGVDVMLITHNSSAVVGPDVTIDAGDIGVQATSSVPSPIENINWDSFSSVIDGLLANTSIITSDADAAAESSELGISGSLNYLSLTQNTTAWVATGAKLTTTDPDSSWATANLSGLDSTSGTPAITTTFDNSLSVLAADTVETINVSGNFAPLGGVNASGGTAVGGSLGLLYDTNNTIAGIAQSTSVTSAGTLDVDAETTDDAINIAPTNGKGAGINLTGLASVFILDDTTSASISNDATVSANSVDVDAVQALGIYTITGDVTQSGASAVGISIAYASLTTSTDAFIGDNATLVGTNIDPDEGDTSALGSVTTGDLDVDAQTTGNDVVGALAVQVATGSSPSPPPPLPSDSKAAALLGITETTSGSSVSLAISGSAAYTDTDLTTAAYLDDAVVKGSGSTPSLTVTASNNTLVVSASGAAALAFGGGTKALTAAVAAAAALDSNSDSTLAYIEGSTVSQFGSVDVDAQSTGLVAVVGLGIAVSQQSSEQPAGGFAGSLSAALVSDRVAAYIDDSTVSNTSSSGNAVVLADQQTEIGIGGGSFFFGGNGGGGLAVTYTDIVDPSASPATDAHISNSSVKNFEDIDVVAESPQAIYSAAAEVTSSSVGIGGAVVVTTDDATTSATISNSGNAPLPITATDDVFVLAATDPDDLPSSAKPATFDSSDSGASAAAADYGVPSSDKSSSDAADADLLSSGSAAILSIAGDFIVGGSNGVGLSSVDNSIGEAHLAQISGVTVTAPDALTVSALDSTAILTIAVGAGDSTQASIQAANVTNSITSSATAFIGPQTGTTLTAATDANVGAATVEAQDSSAISVYALVVAIGNGSADGYSIGTSTIDTQTTSDINAATVTATGDSSDSDATGDVIVAANSSAQIYTYAVGVAASQSVGVAGSAATSLEESDVDTSISGSSIVSATNNVGVLASNDNTVDAVAGAGAISYPPGGEGAGVSVTIDKITGSTEATIASSTVDAQALGTGGLLIVNGVLDPTSTATESAPTTPDASEDPASIPDLGTDVRHDHGLAVVASSVQTADVVAVTLGITQGASLTLNTVTNLMGGTTEAQVSGSALDTNLSAANAAPVIDVGAVSVSYANDLVANVAGSSGDLAASAGSAADSFDRATTARVSGTSIGSTAAAAGTVTIGATGYEGSAGEVLGLALSGGNSVAGTIFVNLFSADTEASLVGGTIDAGSLSVNAASTNGYFAVAGTAAGGTTVGVGATVLVGIFSDTTLATIGDPTDTTATTLNLAGQLTVGAKNAADVDSYAIGASVGGDAGAAAQITYTELDSKTGAALDDSSVMITAPAGDTGNVSVTSQDNATIDPVTGGFAGGGSAGLGASANVVILQSSNQSQISDSDVTTPGAVMVSATSNRDINPYTATGSVAGEFSLAASVGVILVGDAASSDELGLLDMGGDGTLAYADATAHQGTTLVNALNGGVDGISAAIDGGKIIAASVAIDAAGDVETMNLDGSVSLSLGGSIGAAVGYTEVDQSIGASAVGGTIQTGSLSIDATAGGSGQTAALAGAGGLYVGLGAAVGYVDVDNTISAELGSNANGGALGAASGAVAVSASDGSTLEADGYGGAGGAAAVGLSIADAEKTSSVTADIASSTTVGDFDGVIVSAAGAGSVTSYTIAGAAGVFSGAGASSTSKDTEDVKADIGLSASISAGAAGVLVDAVATPDVSASSYGVAVGASVGIGASVAESDADLDVTAYVGDNAIISGGSLTISAASTVPLISVSPTDVYGNTAYAYAVGAGGGLLLGLQATDVTASDDSTVLAYGGTGLRLPSGDVTIAAENDSSQDAEATGIAVGYIGAGATIAQTSSDATTNAYLDTGAVTASTDTGALSITATGTDSNTSDALAGSGGIVAGAAAVATTSATSNMSATLKGDATTDTLYLGGLGIEAEHTTDYSADGDAYQASVVGASGGDTTNNVKSNVTAEVGPNLIINSAGGDMDVIAADTVDESSGGARAGSGGIAAGSATLSKSTVTQNVTTNIDAGTIFSLNDNPATSTASIDIEAYNNLETNDTVSLTAGGLFAGGDAESDLKATATDDVNIADDVELFSAGNLDIGTAAQMLGGNNAEANLYGLVTGAGASTDTSVTANQNVMVGDSILEAWGLLTVYAGQSGDGNYDSTVDADATTVVYNDAVIPISAEYSGTATANDYSSLSFAAGSQVLGANNVFIGATRGAVNAAGDGTNYNPYLSAFSTENHDNNSSTNGSGNVVLNGKVAAGIHNQEIITIGYNGAVSLSSGASSNGLTLQEVSNPDDFNPIVSYKDQTIQYAVVGGFNPYVQIVDEISSLSGLSVSAVESVLSGANPSITITNDDSAGDIQREVNTLIQQAPFASNASGASFAFGDILVSAGNVTIEADTLSGAIVNNVEPSVSATDSTKIDFENQGTDFLDLSNLTVSGVSGGHINFTGAATDTSVVTSSTQGIKFTEDLSGLTPSIIVDASYNATNAARQPIDANGNVLTTTPDIYFNGVVSNVNGLLDITDQLGNVVATQSYDAATIELSVPNGSFTFNGGAGSIYSTNSAVASQWANTEYKPTDTTTAVEAAATFMEQFYLSYYHDDAGNAVVNSVYADSDPANEIFSTRLLAADYNGGDLTSLIFLPMGYPNNDTNAQTVGTSGTTWERHQFQGESYDHNDSGPFNCDNCSPFYTVINIQSQAVNGVTATAATNPPANLPQIVGKAIILSASVLNINGTIESGQSSNYSVDIGSAAETAINNILDNATTLAADKQAAAAGKYVDLSTYLTTVGSSDVKIDAEYDALTDQILLNNVVQGVGGYVYLNGKIISTSTTGSAQGNIIVNGGAGTVDVNNTTGIELVTNTINTGVSAASVIEIVDQNTDSTKWYVYNAGASANQQVSTYEKAGVNNTSYNPAAPVSVGANSNLSYDPAANQLYEWVDTATLSRANNGDPSAYGWSFTGVSANAPTYPYTETTSLTTGTQATNYKETVSATGVYQDYSFNTGDKCCGTDFEGTWNQDIYYGLTLTLTNTVKASYAIGITFNGGGTSNIDINSNASVLVNGSINNLQGNTTIATTGVSSAILSGAAPFVSGESVTLNAPGGIGAAGAALPIQTYGGTLTANSVDHGIYIAATGALSINEVKVSPTVVGKTPQGDVYISATGDINSASAYNLDNPVVVGKSIEIDSTGGAVGATSSVEGGVGTLVNINPLVIEATPTLLANGTIDGGLLTSKSSTGAYIVQSTGNLWLDSVTSNGPVFLEAAGADGKTANILNGVTPGGLTAAQTTYLQNVWASLDLATGSGAAAVSSYEQMIDNAYNNYWQLLNLAFPDGQNYAISMQGQSVLAAQIAAQLGYASSSDVSSAQIETYATTHIAQDEYLLGLMSASQVDTQFGSLDALFGTTSGQTSQFQAAPKTTSLTTALATYQSNFSYALSPTSTLYTDLNTGSQWTLDELTYTVSADANPANGVAAPPIDSLPLNVSARQVMLYAPTGAIGSLAAPTTFSFSSESDASLTDADKALLASAGPGQLSVSTTVEDGVDYYTVSVAQQSLLIVSPLGPVSAKAETQIYLGSASDLNLGGIPNADFGPITAAESEGVQTTSGGDVVLQAIGSILGGVAGQVAISGDIADLTLISEKGSIGEAGSAGSNPATNANALLLALSGSTTGQLDQAEAADGIYIDQTSGDLILGNITGGSGAKGVIQLAASGSIYAEPQFTASAVHIIGSDLDLRAGDNISFNGSDYQPLQVEISGAVTGSAGGVMTILSPESDLNIGAPGTYGVLTSGGAMTLDTTVGDLNVDADVTSGGALDLLANGAVTFAAGATTAPIVASSTSSSVTLISATLSMGDDSSIDADGAISISTTGDATLGQLSSSLSLAGAANGPSISVTAGGAHTSGAIFGNGDGRETVVASGTGADIALSASGGIGTSVMPLAIDTSTATITVTSGNVFVSSIEALDVTSGVATLGSLDISSDAALSLGSLTAGMMLDVTSTGSTVTIGSATSGGTQMIEALGNVGFTTLLADGGDIDVTSDAGSIDGGSATATAGAAKLLATSGGISIGSATSAGLQTLTADAGDVDFTTLQTTGSGSIDLTALNGAVQGNVGTSLIMSNADVTIAGATVSLDIVNAINGTASIDATTALTGTSLTTGGDASLVAGVSTDLMPTSPVTLAWTTVNAGTTFEAQAYGGSITGLGSVTSNGTQTINATEGITFTTLTADAGDIDVTGASISGTSTSPTVLALTSKSGAVMLISTGTGDQSIDVTSVSAATTFGATAETGGIEIGAATSGATQTIEGYDAVSFTALMTKDGGNIDVTSDTASIQGGSVMADGAASLTSATSNTGNTVSAATGSVTLAAGSLSTPPSVSASDSIDWANVSAGTTLAATSGGALSLGMVTSGTLALSNGDETIDADGAIKLTNVTATAGTFGVRSYASTVTIGAATSDGTQTIEGYDAVSYTTLTTAAGNGGNIDVTSDTSSITGVALGTGLNATPDSLAAAGSFDLEANGANGSITATSLTTATGAGTAKSSGAIALVSVSAPAGTLGVTSTGSTVTLDSATSGGTQTIEALGDVEFTTLETTGTGSIDVTSMGGAVAGAPAGTSLIQSAADVTISGDNVALDAVTAVGMASIDAATTLIGTSLTTGGDASLVAGGSTDLMPTSPVTLTWTTVNAGTTFEAQAYGGSITSLGSVTSDGTQTIAATGDITFTTLTANGIAADPGQGIVADAGGIDVASSAGSIAGITVSAAGSAVLASLTSNNGTSVAATNGSVTLIAGSLATPSAALIDWTTANAGTSLTATSGGSLTLIDATSGTTGSGGVQTLHASGAIALTTVNATAGTIGVTSDTSTVTIDAATSDGTQTLKAAQGISFRTLTANGGDIDVTGASIAGTSTSPTVLALTSKSGAVMLTSTGAGDQSIDVTSVSAATTFGATAEAGGIVLGSATSGGTQTLTADAGDVAFTTLQTTDTGSIDLTALNGAVAGEPAGASLIQSVADVTIAGDSVALDTVTAADNVSITAATSNDGGTVTATTGSVTLIAGSLATPLPSASIGWTVANAGTTLGATSGGSLTLGSATSGTTGSDGTQTIEANGPVSLTLVTATAGTLGVTSDSSTIGIGSATSSGTQTIEAKNALTYTTLKTNGNGDIDLTSDDASITGQPTGDTLEAKGSFSVTAATTISGTRLKADNGSGHAKAGEAVDLGTTNVATTLDVTSTGSTVMLGSATSGGTQTIKAAEGITFTTLTATAGDIDVTSSAGSITGGTLTANGSANLSAFVNNAGTRLTTQTGHATLSATTGYIDWQNLNVATTFDATASAGPITLGSATSGGTQTIAGQGNVQFANLGTSGLPSDPGNVTITSTKGQILGGTIEANGFATLTGDGIVFANIESQLGLTLTSGADITANAFETQGPVTINAAGTMFLGTIGAGSISLATPGNISINNLTVATAVDFAAANVNVGIMRQTPGLQGPLVMSLTGYNGGIGESANLTIDSPNGLVITELREDPVTIDTTARQLTIDNALLTGTMNLTTPLETFWFNDRSPTPVLSNDVQLYQPDAQFYFRQDNYATTTNALVVQYGQTAAIDQDIDGILYQGASLVRDINRQGEDGDQSLMPDALEDGQETLWSFPVEEFDAHLRALTRSLAVAAASGAMVNSSGLVEGNAIAAGPGFKIVFKRVRQ